MRPPLRTDIESLAAIGLGTLLSLGVGGMLFGRAHPRIEHSREVRVIVRTPDLAARREAFLSEQLLQTEALLETEIDPATSENIEAILEQLQSELDAMNEANIEGTLSGSEVRVLDGKRVLEGKRVMSSGRPRR